MKPQQIVDRLATGVIDTIKDLDTKKVCIDTIIFSVETDLNDDSEDSVFHDLTDCVANRVEKEGYKVIYPENEGEEEDDPGFFGEDANPQDTEEKEE